MPQGEIKSITTPLTNFTRGPGELSLFGGVSDSNSIDGGGGVSCNAGGNISASLQLR